MLWMCLLVPDFLQVYIVFCSGSKGWLPLDSSNVFRMTSALEDVGYQHLLWGESALGLAVATLVLALLL